MTPLVWGMLVVGTAALVVGLVLARVRLRAAAGIDKVLVAGLGTSISTADGK